MMKVKKNNGIENRNGMKAILVWSKMLSDQGTRQISDVVRNMAEPATVP
jgi:hypothetical protein